MATVTICSDFEAQENKACHCFHCFSIYLPWIDGTRGYDLSFLECWALTQLFHSPLSLSSRSSLVPLHFLHKGGVICISEVIDISLGKLDSSLASSTPAFCMMYSAYKLNKQGDNIQPWHIPFPICNQVCCSKSSSNCCFLTCIQVSQEAGQVLWYSHLLKNFPVYCDPHSQRLWHTQ